MARTTPVLGLSERWSLSRHNVNSAITVIYHASLPPSLIREADLHDAVAKLCEVYPILRCGVEGKVSDRPAYKTSEGINPRDLVRVVQGDVEDLSTLVSTSVLRGKEFNADSGPLWEVQLHRSARSDPSRDRIVLLIDHILCDGLGARNLFADLFTLLSGLEIPPQPTGLPGRMDDAVSLQRESEAGPSSTPVSILEQVQSHLQPIVARLNPLTWTPSSPREYTKYPPTPAPGYNSVTASQQFSQFDLSASELGGLLSEGKKRGVRTIHPVIHVAALMALYRASKPSTGLRFNTSVPISERKEELGHPRSTGNYVTFHFSTDDIDDDTPYWAHTRSFDTALREPQTKPEARYALGKLAHIEHEQGKSGWEEYLDTLIGDPRGPHKLALAVSNVGLMDLPATGRLSGKVDDVYFTQSASAMGAAAVISIMSTRGGSMTVSISSKIGSLPDGVFDEFTIQFRGILQAVARGDLGEQAVVGGPIAGVPGLRG